METLLSSKQSLMQGLTTGRVIPIVGPEVITVDVAGADGGRMNVPFYRLVAEELLKTYELSPPEQVSFTTGSPWVLHRAVDQVMKEAGVTAEKVRRSVAMHVREVASRVSPSAHLRKLASIDAFQLLVILTPDNLLADLLINLRGDRVSIGYYSPNADTSSQIDIPPSQPDRTRLFFPLGRVPSGRTSSRFAIHEEDALEYLFKFHEDGVRRAPNILTELRTKDLLFIGCNLPDWLGRSFLRLFNEDRLSAPEKTMEFFCANGRDPALNAFLARFSPNSTVFPWAPEEFVEHLCELAKGTAPPPVAAEPASIPAGRRATAFVSYASENADAARRIAQTLSELGFGDVWFDKRKLIAGDDWSDRIDEAIEDCDFFVPVLSREADQRREGVFWEEWRKAGVRSLRMNDAFLLPIGIDQARPERVGYDRIFNGFTRGFAQRHTLHAPGGVLSDEDRIQLRERCRRFEEGRGG